MRVLFLVSIGLGALALSSMAFSPQDKKPAGGRYIGTKACKSCHSGDSKGNAYEKWHDGPHAKAYDVLATPAAKAAAKELGIDDPQKSEKCLKCHVTAFGVPDDQIKRGFKKEDGVGCESCHMPGEDHQKKRMREAMKRDAEPSPVEADEMKSGRSAEMCTKCHNKESPTYKPFCLKERMKEIEHLDPRKERSKEELEKLRNTCSPDCEICKEKAKDGGE